MRGSKPALWTAAALDLAFLALLGWAWPSLPDPLATHFDGAGVPNGWSSKAVWAGLSLAILVLLNAVYVALPLQIARLHAELRARLLWFGATALAFLLAVSALVVRANQSPEPHLPGEIVWPLLAGYALFVLGWVVSAVRSAALTRRRER